MTAKTTWHQDEKAQLFCGPCVAANGHAGIVEGDLQEVSAADLSPYARCYNCDAKPEPVSLCPVCDAPKDNRHLLCRKHWRMVDPDLKDAVWRTLKAYRACGNHTPMAEFRSAKTAYVAAARAAIRCARENDPAIDTAEAES